MTDRITKKRLIEAALRVKEDHGNESARDAIKDLVEELGAVWPERTFQFTATVTESALEEYGDTSTDKECIAAFADWVYAADSADSGQIQVRELPKR